MRAALAEADALGAPPVDLTSGPARQAAIRLYQRVGFRRREPSVIRYLPIADRPTGGPAAPAT